MSGELEKYRVSEIAQARPLDSAKVRAEISPALNRYFEAALRTLDHVEYGDPCDFIRLRTGIEVAQSPLSEIWVPAIFRNDARPNSEETLSGLLNETDTCRLVLAGPGGGKSTLAKFATCLTIREYGEGRRDRFGVFVPLSKYKAEGNYRKSIALCAAQYVGLGDDSEVVSAVENSLENAFVIFDGLDELPINPGVTAIAQGSSTRDRAVGHIRTLKADPQRPPNSRITVQAIVTCRETEYLSDPCLGNVATFRLVDFSTRQMNEAVDRWHARAGTLADGLAPDHRDLVENIERRRAAILATLHDNSDLSSLCHRPLMLSILQTVYASGEDIPGSVSHLCERAVRWLLIEKPLAIAPESFVSQHAAWVWEAISALGLHIHERVTSGREKSVDESQLRQLCRETYPAREGAILSFQVRERLTTEMFIHFMGGHGILIVGASGDVDFSHNVFREVMAGRALGKKRVPELRNYALQETWHGPIRYWAGLKAVQETGWHEISALVGELAPDADAGNVSAILAQAEMLVEVCSRSCTDKWTHDLRSRVDAVKQSLLQVLQQAAPTFTQRLRVGDLLGSIGDPRIETPDVYRVVWFDNQQRAQLGRHEPHVTDIAKYQKTPASPIVFGRLQRYALGKYLVTNREYAEFVKAGGYEQERFWPNDLAKKWIHKDLATLANLLAQAREAAQIHLASELIGQRLNYDDIPDWCDRMINRRLPLYWDNSSLNRRNQPVVGINWWEAYAYCAWRSEVLHQSCLLDKSFEVRLPIEAEWENAARLCGGGNVYPWIEGSPSDNAHVRDSVRPISNVRAARSVAVGSYEFVRCHLPVPNYDLVGNVWEWSGSIAEPYSPNSFIQKVDGADLADRIGRGSSWLSSELESTQITFRSYDPPYNAYEDCGLRIAIGQRDVC